MKNNLEAKKLNLGALIIIAVGMVVGAGVVALTGPAIAYTGRSAGLAFAAAALLGLVLLLPAMFISSTLTLEGGEYMIIRALLGKSAAGIYIWNYLISHMSLSVTALAMGVYAQSLVPSLNGTLVSVLTITLFYVVNIFGVKLMSRIQNYLVAVMLIGIVMFVAIGLCNVNEGAFNFVSPEYFTGGSMGFLSAAVLLVFSCTAHQLILGFTTSAARPKRDLPIALCVTSVIIIILYGGIGFVAANVLPITEVAGKPLTVVAAEFLPRPLFVFFIVAVPMLAICSSLNAILSSATFPMLRGAQDGWFPKVLARQNRYGMPIYFLTILYLIALLPILIGFDITTVANNTLLIKYIIKFSILIAAFRLPAKYPELWRKSSLHIPDPLYYLIISACCLLQLAVIIISGTKLTATIVAVSLGVILVLSLCSFAFSSKVKR